ncbi:MAG: diversity-generating retroelement protein Avd [Ectothiorhodospiraceae bacterium]|nr:diversity-generating retroelement protein Avd [Ectothiorhodospiraceae bacterium]
MQELKIAQKVEEMIQYGYVAVRHFPKSERHVLSQELRLSMWRLLRLVIICSKRYHKKTTLQELDAELELLRREIRLAKDLGVLPFKQYEVWARHLDEVGRMVGGWLKKVRG